MEADSNPVQSSSSCDESLDNLIASKLVTECGGSKHLCLEAYSLHRPRAAGTYLFPAEVPTSRWWPPVIPGSLPRQAQMYRNMCICQRHGEDASIPARGYDDLNVHPFPLGDPMT
jgi:hypothetical protein